MNQTVGLVNMSMRVLMQMVKNQNKTQVFLFLQCNYNLYIYMSQTTCGIFKMHRLQPRYR